MYVSDFVCHDHQTHASECGCTRNICPKHKCVLSSDGYNMVCHYCDWPDPSEDDDE